MADERVPCAEARDLCQYFDVKTGTFSNVKKTVKAVDHVSLAIARGETLGIVGESGCGKTTLGKTMLYLEKPTSGKVFLNGQDLSELSREELRRTRSDMQIVFQDPFSSLNGRLTVGTMLTEPMLAHRLCTKAEAQKRAAELLDMVGLRAFHLNRYPHEFSGGQRQRIAIARALATNPKFIVCDEAVSALDVSVQASILNLMQQLKRELGLTYLFISHDLSVVRHVSDRIGVMYLGTIIELGQSEEMFRRRMHPYTQALFAAAPVPKPGAKKEHVLLTGDVPSPIDLPAGCRFHGRCPACMDVCRQTEPKLRELAPGYFCACHLYDQEVKHAEDK